MKQVYDFLEEVYQFCRHSEGTHVSSDTNCNILDFSSLQLKTIHIKLNIICTRSYNKIFQFYVTEALDWFMRFYVHCTVASPNRKVKGIMQLFNLCCADEVL